MQIIYQQTLCVLLFFLSLVSQSWQQLIKQPITFFISCKTLLVLECSFLGFCIAVLHTCFACERRTAASGHDNICFFENCWNGHAVYKENNCCYFTAHKAVVSVFWKCIFMHSLNWCAPSPQCPSQCFSGL